MIETVSSIYEDRREDEVNKIVSDLERYGLIESDKKDRIGTCIRESRIENPLRVGDFIMSTKSGLTFMIISDRSNFLLLNVGTGKVGKSVSKYGNTDYLSTSEILRLLDCSATELEGWQRTKKVTV